MGQGMIGGLSFYGPWRASGGRGVAGVVTEMPVFCPQLPALAYHLISSVINSPQIRLYSSPKFSFSIVSNHLHNVTVNSAGF